MSQTVDFLKKAKVFYLATVDGVHARIRPISSVIEYTGKVYFETSNKKDMYHQMLKNSHVSICGMAEGKWIRITGKVEMDESDELKEVFFKEIPALKQVYSFEELVPYRLKNMNSLIYDGAKDPIELYD